MSIIKMEHKGLIQKFIQYCKTKKILLNERDFEYDGLCLYAKKENIVLELNDNFIVNDGLISWDLISKSFVVDKTNPSYLKGQKYILLIHPLFRLLNIHNFTPSLMDLLWDIGEKQDFSIAIDLNRVRINIHDRIDRPLAGWGQKFSNNKRIEDIDDGICRFFPDQKYNDQIKYYCFKNVHCLDIRWTSRDGLKFFEVEEIKNKKEILSFEGVKYFPSKYLHSTYNIAKNYFDHFDGAIHLYSDEEYNLRYDKNFNFNNSLNQIKPISIKLFKINGILDLESWEILTRNFLAGNPLINEYFDEEYSENTKLLMQKLGTNE